MMRYTGLLKQGSGKLFFGEHALAASLIEANTGRDRHIKTFHRSLHGQ
jgi:hypothetical protein